MTNPDNVGGLPELPEPVGAIRDGANIVGMTGKYVRLNVSGTRLPRGEFPIYTAEQMRAYGELCRAAPAGSGEVSRLELAKMELAVTAALFNYEQGDTVSEWLKNTAALLRKLQQGAECFVREMRTSKGSEFFVVVRCNGRELTPHMYTERWKAEYDVASWQHLLCGAPEPDLLAYGPDAASHDQEGGANG